MSQKFSERFIMKCKLGRGAFASVMAAYDRELGKEVAIKLVSS